MNGWMNGYINKEDLLLWSYVPQSIQRDTRTYVYILYLYDGLKWCAGAPVAGDSGSVEILSGEICCRKTGVVITYVLCMLCCRHLLVNHYIHDAIYVMVVSSMYIE